MREYSEEPVLEESVIDLVKAAQFAPTAMGNRGVEFLIIEKAAAKKELALALEQDFLKKAPVIILPMIKAEKSPLPESDLAVAASFMMVEAASLGLGTVWKHIPKDAKSKVGKLLGIPDDYIFISAVPVGYPLNDLPDHSDADFDEKKVHLEKF